MEGRPLYRTVAAIGLAVAALAFAIYTAITGSSDRPFFGALLVAALVLLAVTLTWAKGIWVSLVGGLALEVMTFWFVFPLMGFHISAWDAVPALIGFVGIWTAIIASILGIKRRREAREFTSGTKRKVLTAAGVVGALSVLSVVLMVANTTTVDDAEAAGATTVLMHDGDKFTPTTLNAEAGEPVKLLLRNDDRFAHTFDLEDEDAGEASEIVGPGSETVVTFTPAKAGTYEFVCEFHSDMTGELVVS